MTLIDTSIADELIALVTSSVSVFKLYPLNIFLVGSLLGLAFSLFRKAKKVAR